QIAGHGATVVVVLVVSAPREELLYRPGREPAIDIRRACQRSPPPSSPPPSAVGETTRRFAEIRFGTTSNRKPKLFCIALYVKPRLTFTSVPMRVRMRVFDRAWLVPKS